MEPARHGLGQVGGGRVPRCGRRRARLDLVLGRIRLGRAGRGGLEELDRRRRLLLQLLELRKGTVQLLLCIRVLVLEGQKRIIDFLDPTLLGVYIVLFGLVVGLCLRLEGFE